MSYTVFMKVGVISDTHDHLTAIEKAVAIFKEHKVEQIVHCGDWVSPYSLALFGKLMEDWNIPVFSVLGNNEGDYRMIFKKNAELSHPIKFADVAVLELSFGGKNVAVYHGHDVPVLNALVLSEKYCAIFTGHTHVIRNENVHDVLILNPGSTSYFSEGKIIDTASVAIYDSDLNSADIITF